MLAWFTGARLGALRGLDLEDYDRDKECVSFIHRQQKDTPLKNGHDGKRIVGLPEPACDVVDAYLRTDRHDQYDATDAGRY